MGDIYTSTIQYIYSNRLNLGKLRREENVLWSFAPHDISVILGLLGEMPESIQAQGGNYLHRKIADSTVSLLNFASGVRAHIFVSWLHPFKEQKLVVVGDRKMAVFDDTAPWPQKLALYPHSVEWSGKGILERGPIFYCILQVNIEVKFEIMRKNKLRCKTPSHTKESENVLLKSVQPYHLRIVMDKKVSIQ